MRRLYWLGLVMVSAAAVAAAGCNDNAPSGLDAGTGGGGAAGATATGTGGTAGGVGTGGTVATGGAGGGVDAGTGGAGGVDAGAAGAGTGGGAAGAGGFAGVAGAVGTGGAAGAAGAVGTGGAAGAAGAVGTGGAAGAAGAVGTGGAAGAAGAVGTGGAAGAPLLAPPAPTGLVALNSDYSSTSLSLLSTSGSVAKASCVHSTTVNGTPTISGNVVLPSQPQVGGKIVLVDRGNGALTFVDPTACTITRQVSVPGLATTNPSDVVIVSDTKAYVTRYLPGPSGATPANKGNDVVVMNPTTGTFMSRIPFDAYASTVAGATILSRPDRALIANGRVVVSLNEVDANYVNYGEGKIAVIDPATDTVVAGIALTGLYDCEGMSYVDASKTLLVACAGPYMAEDQPLLSGVAVVDLSGATPVLKRVISGVAFDDQALNFSWVLAAPTAAGGTRAFVGTNDPAFVKPDALYVFDYVLGTTSKIASSDPYTIGAPANTASLLFVPEATFSSPKVQLFNITGTPQAGSSFVSDTVNGLQPLEIGWY
jgi:hypothetical protein